jgi:hypothetical protein
MIGAKRPVRGLHSEDNYLCSKTVLKARYMTVIAENIKLLRTIRCTRMLQLLLQPYSVPSVTSR